MPIIAFGLSHRTAGIDLRGRASILPSDAQKALSALLDSASFVHEASILSTCNRTEVHAYVGLTSEHAVREHMIRWFANHRNLTLAELDGKTYFHWNNNAVRHILRVATGLDSQVLGEPQIFGQYKDAYQVARTVGAARTELTEVTMAAVRTGKKVRTESEIGKHSISVPQAALVMARQIFSDLNNTRVLLLGAGETICLVSKHMQSANVGSIGVANRTLSRASQIADQVDGHAMPLADFGDRLHEYDIVVSSTNSPTAVVTGDVVRNARQRRRFRPMFFVDLAVPRDIEPSVAQISNVYLYTIDDLTSVIDENLKSRQDSIQQAEQLIEQGLVHYQEENKVRQVSSLITNFRTNVDGIKNRAVKRARARLDAGEDPQEVIDRLANDLTNKLAHNPTLALKGASSAEDQKVLEILRNVYCID